MSPLPDLNTLPLPALFDELTKSGLARRLIELARDEDLGPEAGPSDITTIAWAGGPPEASLRLVRSHIVAHEDGIAAGLAALPLLLSVFAPSSSCHPSVNDGERFIRRQALATVTGPVREVLALERTMLNLLSRLCGVATLTSRHAAAIGPGPRARVFDTRKTTPGLRMLEKYAVRCGGGFCHRLGLYDAVLLKDNHLAGVPTDRLGQRLAETARRARAAAPLRFIEVEADTLEQFEQIARLPAGTIDIALLDNMTEDELRSAVAIRARHNPSLLLEASGGVTLETIRAIALTGVDRISVGAITHSARSLDLALDIEA